MTERHHAPLPKHVYDEMTGLETLRLMISGELPGAPIAKVMNFTLVEASEGFCAFEGEPTADHLNPHGVTHGGWAATIMDSALGCAVHTTTAKGERYTTVEMKVNYLRPILPGITGRVRCEARVINRGRRLAISDARLVDSAGKLYAHGTETCMIFPKGEGG